MTSPRACRAFADLLDLAANDLLDGAEDRVHLELHLAGCSDCREHLEREQSLTASLNAVSRVRASVSVDERVMDAVRALSQRRAATPGLSRRLKATLGGVAFAGFVGELVLSAALLLVILNLPLPGVAGVLDAAVDVVRPLLGIGTTALDGALAVGRGLVLVLGGLVRLLPPPRTAAALFAAFVMVLTFIAVRRDLHGSAAARGLR